MQDKSPLFSVIVPVFNRKELLIRAIDSVLAQTFSSFEIIVVDDNSTDGTMEFIQGLQNDKIRILSNTKTKGASGARNTGLEIAKGEWVAFLDSDDWWDLNKLNVTKEHIDLNSSFDVFYSSCYYVNMAGELNPIPTKGIKGEFSSALGRMNPIRGFSSLVVKRESLKMVSGFDENLPARQDVDLYFRLSKTAKFYFIPKLLAFISFANHDKISSNQYNRLYGWIMVYKKHKLKMKKSDHYYQEKRIFYYAWKLNRYDLALRYMPGAIISFFEKILKPSIAQ
jgi:glycosyltransferase involved in cell wall biosynthesis